MFPKKRKRSASRYEYGGRRRREEHGGGEQLRGRGARQRQGGGDMGRKLPRVACNRSHLMFLPLVCFPLFIP